MVSPAKQIFKDFSSGKGGSAVTFLMELEQMSYPEALRWLASKYNIEVEEEGTPEERDERKKEADAKESLHIANTFAQKHYTHNLLNTEEGKSIGLTYLKERGFSDAMIEKFQLGYAKDSYHDLLDAGKAAGHQPDMLVKAGLLKYKEDSKNYFDFFRARVQFTIHNYIGKVVGFGGRALKKDEKAKYVNTPETEVYNKSELLYGLFQAKTAVRKADVCYLVEGYTDVISLVQAGIENVAASSGTALTKGQIKLIKRLTPNITFLYDGDAAGVKAALRGIDLVLEEDMNVKLVLLPDGEDPDSAVRNMGASGFQDFIDANAKDFLFFKTEYLLKDAANDPVKRTTAIRDIIDSLALIPDPIKRSLYVKECAQQLQVEEQLLITEINKVRNKKRQQERRTKEREDAQRGDTPPPPDRVEDELLAAGIDVLEPPVEENLRRNDAYALQEKELVRLLLEFAQDSIEEHPVVHIVLQELEGMELQDKTLNQILTEIKEVVSRDELPDVQQFLNHESQEVAKVASDILFSPYELSPLWEEKHEIIVADPRFRMKEDVHATLTLFKFRKLGSMINELQDEIKAVEKDQEMAAEEKDAQLNTLLKKKMKYYKVRNELAKLMGITMS